MDEPKMTAVSSLAEENLDPGYNNISVTVVFGGAKMSTQVRGDKQPRCGRVSQQEGIECIDQRQ